MEIKYALFITLLLTPQLASAHEEPCAWSCVPDTWECRLGEAPPIESDVCLFIDKGGVCPGVTTTLHWGASSVEIREGDCVCGMPLAEGEKAFSCCGELCSAPPPKPCVSGEEKLCKRVVDVEGNVVRANIISTCEGLKL